MSPKLPRDRIKDRKRLQRLRHDAIMAYGGYRCVCCGEETKEFLALDHINNDGAEQRRVASVAGTPFLYWLKNQGYPPGLQVLCHNCNSAKGYYGQCPHRNSENSKSWAEEAGPAPPPRYKGWTDGQIKALLLQHRSHIKVSEITGLRPSSVQTINARRLHVCLSPWTSDVLGRLQEEFPHARNDALAVKFGVSTKALAKKAWELGLKKSPEHRSAVHRKP